MEWSQSGRGASQLQLLVADSTRSPLLFALAGLLRSAQNEYPGRQAQIIGCEGLSPENLLGVLTSAAVSQSSELFIEGSKARVPKWHLSTQPPVNNTVWRNQGCYCLLYTSPSPRDRG